MCCTPQTASFPWLDIIQTVASIVALGLSIYFFIRANQQFRENQRDAAKEFKENQNQLTKMSSINAKQQEVVDKLLLEFKKISKPILKLTPVFIYHCHNIENIGDRYATNIEYLEAYLNEATEPIFIKQILKFDKIYPDQKRTIDFLNKSEIKEAKFLYVGIKYYDDVLETFTHQQYFYDIDVNYSLDECDYFNAEMLKNAVKGLMI